MLEAIGIDQATEDVYRVMLKHPRWGVGAIAEHLGRPEGDVRASLDALANLSLLRPSWDSPGDLMVIRPERGLQVLLDREQVRLHDHQRNLDETRSAIGALMADFGGDQRPADFAGVERIVGLDEVRMRLEELAERTTEEVLSFQPAPQKLDLTCAAARPVDLDSLARGMRFRSIYHDSVAYDPAALAYVAELVTAGAEFRVSTEVPVRLIVADRATAVVPVDASDAAKGALFITEAGAVTALISLFDAYWLRAGPLADVLPDAPAEITPLDRRLLQLLASGAKDEAVARHLGVSVRTVRRQIAELMERLRASSRFEAGVRAAARGWL